MKTLHNRGIRIQLSCEKKDAIPMKNKLVTLRHRMDKVVQRSATRAHQLDVGYADAQLYFEARDELLAWVEASVEELKHKPSGAELTTIGGERLRELVEDHKHFQEQITRRRSHLEMTLLRGKALAERAPPHERKPIDAMNEALSQKWEELGNSSLKR